jgi:DNA-binding winged helix-turn-helix (wHTH) protein
MAGQPQNVHLLRFGVFEVDLQGRELRKGGLKIKIHDQPFQILAVLLEHPGEIVTREELRQKLWPADTFVDFDHSLNTAVNKLREALGDSAESPRFIETLPRRGYRFFVPSPLRTKRLGNDRYERFCHSA